jgi:hypothetical protein
VWRTWGSRAGLPGCAAAPMWPRAEPAGAGRGPVWRAPLEGSASRVHTEAWVHVEGHSMMRPAEQITTKLSYLHCNMTDGTCAHPQTHGGAFTAGRPPGVASRKRRTSWPGRKASGPSRAMKSLAHHLAPTRGHQDFLCTAPTLSKRAPPGSRPRWCVSPAHAHQACHRARPAIDTPGFRQVYHVNGGTHRCSLRSGSTCPVTERGQPTHGSCTASAVRERSPPTLTSLEPWRSVSPWPGFAPAARRHRRLRPAPGPADARRPSGPTAPAVRSAR